MRVVVVQFAPEIGRVRENVSKARRLCERLRPNSVDLVCLPEMIFSGYVFPNSNSILPYLEDPLTGPTSRFCAELSTRLKCYVACGFPERLPQEEVGPGKDKLGNDVIKVGANSALLYDPQGSLITKYRKTNLFEVDMNWAKAGTGFVTVNLPEPLGVVTLAICMDLNVQPPAEWLLEEGPYELADHCIAHNTKLLILLNSWLDSGTEESQPKDWITLNYWSSRLRPLWVAPSIEGSPYNPASHTSQNTGHETFVVICNRSGEENGIKFAGTSSIFSMRRRSGRPALLHCMDRREEDLRIVTLGHGTETSSV